MTEQLLNNLYNKTYYAIFKLEETFAPLRNLGVRDFSYYKISQDGKMLYLSSNHLWHQKHYLNGCGFQGVKRSAKLCVEHDLSNVIFAGSINNPHASTQLMFALGQEMNAETMLECDMWNASCYYFFRDTYFESFNFFGGNNGARLLDLFEKNSHYLRKYMSYFLIQAKPIFDEIKASELFDLGFNFTDFDKSTIYVPRIIKSADNQDMNISETQFKLLNFLSKGKPMKQVESYLGISQSAANNYLMRLKAKLGFSKTSDLIRVWYSSASE